LLRRVADFKRIFDDLIKQGLPCFWDEKGDFLPESEYHKKIIERCQDHSSFQDLSAPLKGETIFEILGTDFNILYILKNIIIFFPPISYEYHT